MPECVYQAKSESQITLASSSGGGALPDKRPVQQKSWFSRRTKMERCLLLALTACLFMVLGTGITIASVITKLPDSSSHAAAPLKSKQTTPCLTKGCVVTASKLIRKMDTSVNPCDDFYRFSCGTYLKEEVIPDEKSAITQFTEIDDELKQKLRILVEEPIAEKDTVISKMVKDLYNSCMNTDRIQKEGVQPLKDILKEMGGWPVLEGSSWSEEKFSWLNSIYTNRRLGYSIDYLVDFSVTINLKNSTWRIIDIDQPPLGMPSRKYLLKGFNDTDVQAYYNYQVKIAELLGADPEVAKAQLKESLLFEIEIANMTLPKEERRNATKLYNKMTLAELQRISPVVPWVEYSNKILHPLLKVPLTEDEEVIVNVPKYVKGLTALLNKTSKRTLANYLMWRISASSISYLSEDVRDVQLKYSKAITGKAKRAPRWKECMGAVSGSLSSAMGGIYAKKFFKEDAKAAADEMVTYIRAEFDNILRNIDWMDEKTRERALNKSKAITSHIAYPKEILEEQNLIDLYDGLIISNGSLLHNMRNLTIFGTNYSFKRLRQRVDKNDWKNHAAAAVVNAYYSPLENSIQFPAGILQGTFFDAERPKYMNFGAIGFVIGHEITHGFDDTGRQFDATGDLRNWWETDTRNKFLNKSKCIIYQYGNYSVPDLNMNLNGINTQGENIADNGGIKEAYYAYKKWILDNQEEDPLPALPYSSKQLFWLSAANVWCGKYRPESLKLRILTGSHSPAEFRVNGPFSNMKEFSKDWNCPVGSKMNPVKKCSVW